jgi:hypothetical protein
MSPSGTKSKKSDKGKKDKKDKKGDKDKKPKKPKVKRAAKRKSRKKYTAETADRHELYQLAVQSPEADLEFLVKTYRALNKKIPHFLREDFCGTALLCAEWVKQGPKYIAHGYDLDPDPVEWGREHNLEPLGDDKERVTVFLEDCRTPSEHKPDIRVAQNFSYSLFKEREELLHYFRCAYETLADDGIFVMDMYGGPESTDEMEEEREIAEGFTYVWDQHQFFPGTGEFQAKIHFQFEDGTELRNAFEYDWRVWYMPEVKDMLREVGFTYVGSYFEGDDEDSDEGDGDFQPDERGENCAAWIAYLVARK